MWRHEQDEWVLQPLWTEQRASAHWMLLLEARLPIPACKLQNPDGPISSLIVTHKQKIIEKLTTHLWMQTPEHFTILMCHWQVANLSLPNVLTAINVGLDQILLHQSEAVSGQGILIGRIYRLYLHGPSSLNCDIDLGLGHEGLASRQGRGGGVVMGE